MKSTMTIDRLDLPLYGEYVLAAPMQAEAEFNVEPGQREILAADPNDSQPGFPSTCNVFKVIAMESIMCADQDAGYQRVIAKGDDITSLVMQEDQYAASRAVMDFDHYDQY